CPVKMIGYFGEPQLTVDAYTEDGYYKTGDLAEISADGYIKLCGRKRDLFNTPEGTNIYPERIELLIEACPLVKQVVLIGDAKPCSVAFIPIVDEGAGAGPRVRARREHAAL